MTYSFESPKIYDKINLAEDDMLRQSIKITNPLGEDYSVMRTSALGGMLTSLATNYNRRNKNVRLYELANVYIPKALPLTELPDERTQLTLGMYGDGDFFTIKGVIEELFAKKLLKVVIATSTLSAGINSIVSGTGINLYLSPSTSSFVKSSSKSIISIINGIPCVNLPYNIASPKFNLFKNVLYAAKSCCIVCGVNITIFSAQDFKSFTYL